MDSIPILSYGLKGKKKKKNEWSTSPSLGGVQFDMISFDTNNG